MKLVPKMLKSSSEAQLLTFSKLVS